LGVSIKNIDYLFLIEAVQKKVEKVCYKKKKPGEKNMACFIFVFTNMYMYFV
jgi:hypothetical protein